MDEVEAGARRDRAVLALLPLFFLSGATALAYQTVWVRELQLVFGTSTFAISTVLSSFMAGLAGGGFLAARWADKVARPLRVYGLLEIGIGLYALVFPWLVVLITPVYLGAWRALQPGPLMYGVIQFALVGVLLLLPTALMGATLPLLARFATHRLGAAGDRIGTLYAVNTAGAVAGTFLCGFVLLPMLGRMTTTGVAATANLVLGVAAVALDAWARGTERRVTHDLHVDVPAAALPVVAVSIGLAGFSALIYEVAWTRVLALMLGASVYSFTVMLLAFLVGIALGGRIGGPLADRWMRQGGVKRVLVAFAAIEVGIALVSYLLMYVYPELPFWYVWVFDAFDGENHPRAVWAVSLLIAGLIMTPPAVLMGVHFPIAVRAVVGREDALGGPVGMVYGANTLGGVLGAFVAGFALLPTVGVQWTVFVAAVAEFVAAGLLLFWAERKTGFRYVWGAPIGLAALTVAFLVARPPWDPMLMTAGMYHYVSHFEDHTREGILSYSVGQYDLVFYEEGLSSVVTVAKNRDTDNMWLANNGKVDASTTTDMPTQVLCSLLPVQFLPEPPKDVLVIGLASGVTAGALAQVESIVREDVVELEPAIREAALYFGEANHDVLSNPKVNLIMNDGRNHVLLSAEGTYDMIVSEPPNPWISGVANLFTKDFLEIGKTRLKPGGVWSQWVQLYGMSQSDLESLLRTFAEVYPHVLVYATIQDADLVLVGSDSPMVPSPENAAKLFQYPGVVSDLAMIPITTPMGLVALFHMDRSEIMKIAADAPFNTDDNMRIEYSAPLSLHVDTQESNMNYLLRHAMIPYESLGTDPEVWADLARTYQGRDDTGRAVPTMWAAAKRLPEEDPRRQEWTDEAQAWRDEVGNAYGVRPEVPE